MIRVKMEVLANGTMRPVNRISFEALTTKFAAGEHVFAKLTRKRSVRQNNLFHALCQAAYDNQRAGPTLPSWEHLKGWLLIQAGHCTVTRFAPEELTPRVAAAFRKSFADVDFVRDGTGAILMKQARSVAFNETNADEMQAVMNRVVDLICTEIVPGASPEDLLQAAKEAA